MGETSPTLLENGVQAGRTSRRYNKEEADGGASELVYEDYRDLYK